MANEHEPLTFKRLQEVCNQRKLRYHPTPEKAFTILEMAGAMAGEAGEAANVAKKIRRIDLGINLKKVPKDRAALVFALGLELADIFIYAAAVAHMEGIDLEDVIRYKFNQTSDDEGFPERL